MRLFGTCEIFPGSQTEHLTHLVTRGVDAVLLHLELHQFAGQHYLAYIVTRVSLHRYLDAFLQRQVSRVMEITLTRILELHFNQVGQSGILRHIGQPVAHGQHERRVAFGSRSG